MLISVMLKHVITTERKEGQKKKEKLYTLYIFLEHVQ